MFNNEGTGLIRRVKDEKGVIEAVKKEWDMFTWDLDCLDAK